MDEGDAEDRGDRQHHPFVIAIGEEADQIPPMRAVVEVKGRAGAANLDHADENRQDDQRQEQPHASFPGAVRSEEHTSELQSLMRSSYAVFCLKKKTNQPS